MKTYYIYHIEGVKVGCTSDLQKRMADQGFTSWNILEEHTDIIEASNREIQLQKEYGLPVDKSPYYISVQNRPKWTKEAGERGRTIGRAHILGGLAMKGVPKSKEWKDKKPWLKSHEVSRRPKTCEHCNRSIDGFNFRRWHGDNCKLNPQKGL